MSIAHPTYSISTFCNHPHKILKELATGPISILQRNVPAAVLVSPDEWQHIGEKLQRLQHAESLLFHYQRREEMRNDPTLIVTDEQFALLVAQEGLTD